MDGSPICFPGLILCFAIAVAIFVSHQPALGYIPSNPTSGSSCCCLLSATSPPLSTCSRA
ncbi:hypothetical protein M440DRAFT_1405473 [Trichoderma longibrachiatum ATCC 18648]|uniref:Hydrophobin n=1 Tax=Trichoderma longibrachiatum ATCC 18648 TaxID=983965 RepID=A0A2T4BT28_TRILO|nr:hypothetical protein M440DRAFT_1405473 [Trichoderma longibrachiatum ATCC 18648]